MYVDQDNVRRPRRQADVSLNNTPTLEDTPACQYKREVGFRSRILTLIGTVN